MTPERLELIIETCFRRRRMASLPAHYQDIAAFFRVEPDTLRRWRNGETPIPRGVEVVMEIFHAWPDVTAEKVDAVIAARDATSNG